MENLQKTLNDIKELLNSISYPIKEHDKKTLSTVGSNGLPYHVCHTKSSPEHLASDRKTKL